MARLSDVSEETVKILKEEHKVIVLSHSDSLAINERISRAMQKSRRIAEQKQFTSRAESAKIVLTS